ncbi:LuxR C-terminal-related transcriptional regulator [Mycobacterium sp. LTG2003]
MASAAVPIPASRTFDSVAPQAHSSKEKEDTARSTATDDVLHDSPAQPDPENCLHRAVKAWSEWFGREVPVTIPNTPDGAPPRPLFEVLGSDVRFMSISEVEAALLALGNGAAALLASRWADRGGRSGGHMWMAFNKDGRVFYNECSGHSKPTDIAPDWEIARTAAALFNSRHQPVYGLVVEGPPQLGAVEKAIGPVQGLPGDRLAKLTSREREVAELAGQGKSNAEIAAQLSITPATAAFYINRIMPALGARDRAELVAVVYEHGLVRPGSRTDMPRIAQEDLGQLSRREREVLSLLLGGLSTEEIATQMSTSPSTSRVHVSRILHKLGARDRAQLMAMAYHSGMASPGLRTDTPVQPLELTQREQEVLELVAKGLSNAEIATRLSGSPAYVGNQVTRIMSKLDTRDRVQLVIAAYESGLLRPEPQSDTRTALPSSLVDLGSLECTALALLLEGLSTAEIAARLSITQAGVSSHLYRIMAKLGVHKRTQLVAMVYESGLIHPGLRKMSPANPASVADLSEQERDVLLLVAAGLSNSQIDAELSANPGTANFHVGRVAAKLSALERHTLVALAYDGGLMNASKQSGPSLSATVLAQLTPREQDVLALLFEGIPVKEIAAALALNPPDARFHLSNITAKFGARDLAQLVALAYAGDLDLPTQNASSDAPAPDQHSDPDTAPRATTELTAREHDVLCLVAAGLSNPEIADQLSTKPGAVAGHVGRIKAKLDVSTRSELVVAAYSRGLVRPGSPADGAALDPTSLLSLTLRESEILPLLLEGRSNADIAEHVSLSTQTTRFHVSNILTKLAARDQAQLVAMAYRGGLATAPSHPLAQQSDQIESPQTETHPRTSLAQLTQDENAVLRLVAAGLPNPEIAIELSISPAAVAEHINHISKTLATSTRSQLVALAYKTGLVRPGSHTDPTTIVQKRLLGLTTREREVLTLLSDGLSNAETAIQLSLTPHEIRSLLRSIASKLAARDHAHLVAMAYQSGLAHPVPEPLPDATHGNALCGPEVVEYLDRVYPHRLFQLAATPTAEGVPARAVFEAVGVASGTEFASFVHVAQRLSELGPGSAAVVAWSWASDNGRQGGHGAVVVNDNGSITLWDPHTKRHYPYDPATHQFSGYHANAVATIAAGYLDPAGQAAVPLAGDPEELTAAERVGHIQGHPDNDFERRVNPDFALPAQAVVDSANPALAQQLAAELSGMYGPYLIKWTASPSATRMLLDGAILHGAILDEEGLEIGVTNFRLYRDAGVLRAHRGPLIVEDVRTWVREELERELTSILQRYLELSDIHRLTYDRTGDQPPDRRRRLNRGIPSLEQLTKDYRGENPATRQAKPLLADPLKEVLKHPDRGRVGRLAQDLSGLYGPYRVRLTGKIVAKKTVVLEGPILDWNLDPEGYYREIGRLSITFDRDSAGNPVAYHEVLEIRDRALQDNGFRSALAWGLKHYYRESGVSQIRVASRWENNYNLARRGLAWSTDPKVKEHTFAGIKQRAAELLDSGVSTEAQDILNSLLDCLPFNAERGGVDVLHPLMPEPRQLAELSTDSEPDLGKRLLENIYAGFADDVFLDGIDSVAPNCAHQCLDEHSLWHGHPAGLGLEPSRTGVPARRVYESLDADVRFVSYLQVEERLRSLGEGASALISSRWRYRGGRPVSHMYRAVNIGNGAIEFSDPYFGRRSTWPPPWGEHTVTTTAAAFFHPNGDPVYRLDLEGPAQLGATEDAIGLVQGGPHDGDELRPAATATLRRLADEALALRGVASAAWLRNPTGAAELASSVAQNNAAWWKKLTPAQQYALTEVYPQHVGNAEGVPVAARHAANVRSLQQLRNDLQAKRERGEPISRPERDRLARYNRIQRALDTARTTAERAGLDGPHLLAFDPMAFGGSGRALVSFGEDPYEADRVLWNIPGQGMTIDQLGYCMGDALNNLRSALHEDPDLKAASITWIGYETPSGQSTWQAARHTFARLGGEILYSDIRAFNAARDVWAGDGSHFTDNHIFAHSYGSTTTSYAGRGGRLHDDVHTITLAGSPGAGPVRHAEEFGIGDNVFVASSSRDPFTSLGGRTPESAGRIFGIGLGVDPSMDSFGARRITAEFAAAMDHRSNRGTHNAYFRYADKAAEPPLRSESLANFGRIAAGRLDQLHLERHRTTDGGLGYRFGWRTIERASQRRLRLDGDGARQPSDRRVRRPWNPRWRPDVDCARFVVDELFARTGRRIHIGALSSRKGVPARTLFEAIGTTAEFDTYLGVEKKLLQMGPGSSAVLASRWAQTNGGGHAYLAVNLNGRVYLADQNSELYTGWPPYWGQEAVSYTAVAYLHANGEPVSELTDRAELDHTTNINVRGYPDDDGFARSRSLIAEVVDGRSRNPERVQQLAAYLSRQYGRFSVQFDVVPQSGELRRQPSAEKITGAIHDGGRDAGEITWGFGRGDDNKLVARLEMLHLFKEDLPSREFAADVLWELVSFYFDSGIERIELSSFSKSGYALALLDCNWDREPAKLAQSLAALRKSFTEMAERVSRRTVTLLENVIDQLISSRGSSHSPWELANLATSEVPNLGEQLLSGTHALHFVKDLGVTVSHSAQNCGQAAIAQLSQWHERGFQLDAAPSERGVPARELFEAIGSDVVIVDTYDDVADDLRSLGNGASALLVSSWSGGPHRSGHAYLARLDDGQIKLWDPFTGEWSGWPPYWGEGALSLTAVGYLDDSGDAALPPDGASQLFAIDSLHVQGVPTSAVDTRKAEPLGDVVRRSGDIEAANRLANDLSGRYGPYDINWRALRFGSEIRLTGVIVDENREIGHIQRIFDEDDQGRLVAVHNGLNIDTPSHRHNGFSKALAELERYYVRSGVDRIELRTHDVGGYVWARRGYTWDPDPGNLQKSIKSIQLSAEALAAVVSEQSRAALDEMVHRLGTSERRPEPIELAYLATPDEPELGRRLLEGVGVQKAGGLHLVRYLPTPGRSTTWSATELRAWFRRRIGSTPATPPNSAQFVAEQISQRYGRRLHVEKPRSTMGVPAWALFQAIRSSARFATYAEVTTKLRELGDGSSAVLVSSWLKNGRSWGGHAYLAVNDGGVIRLADQDTGALAGWPPKWGEGAVARTAVGYLTPDGEPVEPLHDVPLQLQPADTHGDVGSPRDVPDFVRQLMEYRKKHRAARVVDTSHAEPLGDVLDNAADTARLKQLADDLTGWIGPYRVIWGAFPRGSGKVDLNGLIRQAREIGSIKGTFSRDAAGSLVVEVKDSGLYIYHPDHRGRRFSKALMRELVPYFQRSGVDRLEVTTDGDGGYAWARAGISWDPDPQRLQVSMASVMGSAERLLSSVDEPAQQVLRATMQQLRSGNDRPQPIDLANLTAPGCDDLGRRLMVDTEWYGVLPLQSADKVN